MDEYLESASESPAHPFLPTLLPRFGVLAVLNIVAAFVGRLIQGQSAWLLCPTLFLIGMAPVAYLVYLAIVAVRVVVAPAAAHPVDRWLCKHSGVLSLVLGVVPFSVYVAICRTSDNSPAWSAVEFQLIQFALELSLILAVTCLIPFYPHGHVPREERWKLINVPVLFVDLILIVAIPVTALLAAIEGRAS